MRISFLKSNTTLINFLATALLVSDRYTSVNSHQVGNYEREEKPTITLKEFTNANGCTSTKAKLTLDANLQ